MAAQPNGNRLGYATRGAFVTPDQEECFLMALRISAMARSISSSLR